MASRKGRLPSSVSAATVQFSFDAARSLDGSQNLLVRHAVLICTSKISTLLPRVRAVLSLLQLPGQSYLALITKDWSNKGSRCGRELPRLREFHGRLETLRCVKGRRGFETTKRGSAACRFGGI